MDRLQDALERINSRLTQLGIQHALVGGLAVSAWGKARLTKDVDLKVGVDRSHIGDLLARLGPGYRPLGPEALAAAPQMGLLFLLDDQDVRIDLMMLDTAFDAKVLERAVAVELMGGRTFPTATAEDVIVYKLLSSRPHDFEDASSIVKRQKDRLDRDYILDWLGQFEEALDDGTLISTFESILR